MKEMFSMVNQQVYPNNIMERMSTMKKNDIPVVKTDLKKAVYKDITQTKEFWSNLAVMS